VGGLLGGAVLALGIDASSTALGAGLLLLGSTVATPLALGLVDPGARRGRFALARWLHVPAAAFLCVSFVLAPGAWAAATSVPWLLFTFGIAVLGVLRFAERGGGPANEIAIDTGLVLLAVGGIWTTASRAGAPLLGFAEPWVLLTGAHFHFAGLVLPIATGLAARIAPGALGRAASIGVALGVPFVAAGITAGASGWPALEWVAATWLALAAVLAAGTLARAARAARATPGPAAVLLVSAALALLVGMGLVAVYATSRWLGSPMLSIQDMLRSHAPINAIGFALVALLGLRGCALPHPPPGMEVLLPLLGDEPAAGAWESRALGPAVAPGDIGYAVDEHLGELAREAPGAPVPGGPFTLAASAIMRYRAFSPSHLVGLRGDPDAPATVGETIRARYAFLTGMDLVFAARVIAVFDEANGSEHRAGFTYRTLAGHPECGEETFEVRKELGTGRVFARISARSRPGTWLVRVLRPLARRRQLAAGRAAIANLQRVACGRG
jgi:uncharacterized protein (UPF0548 family)